MSQCHCSHRAAPPKDRCVDSLCVNCGLSVKGRARVGCLVIGRTGNWSITENADGNLEFAYRGQSRLVIQKNGGTSQDSLTAQQITAGTITSNEITSQELTAQNITAETITNNEITSQQLTAQNTTSETISSNEITTQTLNASNTTSGQVTITEQILNFGVGDAPNMWRVMTNPDAGTGDIASNSLVVQVIPSMAAPYTNVGTIDFYNPFVAGDLNPLIPP